MTSTGFQEHYLVHIRWAASHSESTTEMWNVIRFVGWGKQTRLFISQSSQVGRPQYRMIYITSLRFIWLSGSIIFWNNVNIVTVLETCRLHFNKNRTSKTSYKLHVKLRHFTILVDIIFFVEDCICHIHPSPLHLHHFSWLAAPAACLPICAAT